ncbi:MAG: hypothetical protein ACTHNW_04445 [Mucilaginibacter sp.]
MVPFHLAIELNDLPVTVQVEQLDFLADENGLMRYDVRNDHHHAVISINIESVNASKDFTFEAIQAPDEAFSGEDLFEIVAAIKAHNHGLRQELTGSLSPN